MNRATLIPFLVTIILPLLWLLAEFRSQRTFRVALGILAFCFSIVTIFLMSWVTKVNTVQPVAESVHELVDATVDRLEDGKVAEVLGVLRAQNSEYRPVTREQEAYLERLTNAIAELRSGNVSAGNGLRAELVFKKEAWDGFWSDGSTNGFLIIPNYSNYDIYRSGVPPKVMTSVSVSDDFRKLTFHEADLYLYSLTLQNKYQAELEIFNLERKEVERRQLLWRLVLPSKEQMRYTESN